MKQLKQMLLAIQSRFPRSIHFARLARFDKPIGFYLLLWPTLSALWIAAGGWPGWHLFLVFTLGTALTRSAGCIMNDIADRNFDGLVKRTKDRPIASGDVDVFEAVLFMAVLCFLALLLVLSTNLVTVILACAGVAVAAIYPYMKRYTYLPQAVLGVAFSFGILMAFTAVSNEVTKLTGLLLIANMIWAVVYDSEYAMVDREDDLKLGLRSSAILFGDMDRLMIGVLQLFFLFAQYLVWMIAELHWPFLIGIIAATGFFAYQQFLIRNRDLDGCFSAFLNNHWLGLAIFVSITVDKFLFA
jgi:4-hydroxybenzoate polyprenyltransferase